MIKRQLSQVCFQLIATKLKYLILSIIRCHLKTFVIKSGLAYIIKVDKPHRVSEKTVCELRSDPKDSGFLMTRKSS